MRSSSPSKAHSTHALIKVQHRLAKKGTRRRRVDLPCGCSYFRPIICHAPMLSHRGTHHCSSTQPEESVGDTQMFPSLPNLDAPQQAIPNEQRHHHRPDTVQSQPEESVGDTQMFPSLPNLDDLTASDWSFLKGL
ncbi:transcriptional activator protein [Spinach yellow vein Sikar virus]|uniref:Transcriptional activator protein n=2 Tax=Spinach yellow vein virus TaxID=1256523 RepID=V5SPP1_9GEMI|nr:transcriptional activator protein [Spinach yellow vein Sikar virus]AFW90050.1 transcription activator protein [Spinach yellow vein virus]AHB52746.1 transcriptional activator protein [Spinach yellow vein Sikar virus]